jgi:hypothetical protein
MKIKIQKDKWCGMRKLIKNKESRQFSRRIQNKKRNNSSMNELGVMVA